MFRREYLGAVLTSSVGGCLVVDIDRQVVVSVTIRAGSDDGRKIASKESEKLEDDEYGGWPVKIYSEEMQIHVALTVESGPPVDYITLPKNQFPRFQDDKQYVTVDRGTWLDVKHLDETFTLPRGNYWNVFGPLDNE